MMRAIILIIRMGDPHKSSKIIINYFPRSQINKIRTGEKKVIECR